jgi:DNA-binding response OmpR family regulator
VNKILIVEDDELLTNIYRNKFLVEGFQVEASPDGENAMQLVRSFRPDAVLLDLMLPKKSGVELMKEIRAEPGLSKLPLIIFSNMFLTTMVREAWKAGATKCLSKTNCTPKEVLAAVRNAIGGGTAAGPSGAKASLASAHSSVNPVNTPLAKPREDGQFQTELHRTFVASLPSILTDLRGLLQELSKAENEATRLNRIRELCHQNHLLAGGAALADLPAIAQMAEALEALLNDLHAKPKSITVSPLRTVASSIDTLGRLFDSVDHQPDHTQSPRILVVDDEAISRRAIVKALEVAKLNPFLLADSTSAYNLLEGNAFDLIFLDVDMPGMSGLELCSKLRGLPLHKATPIVFVTSLDDFESRANSKTSGGTDYITKPFLFVELAVKALIYVLRGQARSRN